VALILFFAELIQAKNGWWWRRTCSMGVFLPFFAELPQAKNGMSAFSISNLGFGV
jgi:hypothetical protein